MALGPRFILELDDTFRTFKRKVEERLSKLEKDSHPPQPFVSCRICGAVCFEATIEQHMAYHERKAEI